MRPFPALLALALVAALPAAAQDAPAESPRPSLRSTYVAPAGPGEAVRITVYARRPVGPGRLAQRYKGLRANRTVRTQSSRAARATPAAPLHRSPRATFIRQGGSYFQVVPNR